MFTWNISQICNNLLETSAKKPQTKQTKTKRKSPSVEGPDWLIHFLLTVPGALVTERQNHKDVIIYRVASCPHCLKEILTGLPSYEQPPPYDDVSGKRYGGV